MPLVGMVSLPVAVPVAVGINRTPMVQVSPALLRVTPSHVLVGAWKSPVMTVVPRVSGSVAVLVTVSGATHRRGHEGDAGGRNRASGRDTGPAKCYRGGLATAIRDSQVANGGLGLEG